MLHKQIGNEAGRELMYRRFRWIRDALGYQEADAIERLLIDQAALSHVHLETMQRGYARVVGGKSLPLRVARHWEHMLSAAQRQHLRAVEALARVRKLLGRPDVQVNIAADGGQQIVANAPVQGRAE